MKSTKKFYKDGQHIKNGELSKKAISNISFEIIIDDRKKVEQWTDEQKIAAIAFLKECLEQVENELYSFPARLFKQN